MVDDNSIMAHHDAELEGGGDHSIVRDDCAFHRREAAPTSLQPGVLRSNSRSSSRTPNAGRRICRVINESTQ
jgi:hypothetical protein